MVLEPCNCSLQVRESIGITTPKVGAHLGVWGFIPSHCPTLPGAWDVTPELPSWPTPLQAFALVVSPKLGLRHYTRRYNQNTNLLKVIEILKTYLNMSWLWTTPQGHAMYPALWNQLKCVKTPCHSGHVGYMAFRLVYRDCHPPRKPCPQKEISNQDPIEGSFQTSRSRISSDHINMLGMLPKTPPFFSNSLERHKRPCCLIFD
jgi:uncharacterized membrane protein YhdT